MALKMHALNNTKKCNKILDSIWTVFQDNSFHNEFISWFSVYSSLVHAYFERHEIATFSRFDTQKKNGFASWIRN